MRDSNDNHSSFGKVNLNRSVFRTYTFFFKRRRISNIHQQPIPQSGGCNAKRTITVCLEPRHGYVQQYPAG